MLWYKINSLIVYMTGTHENFHYDYSVFVIQPIKKLKPPSMWVHKNIMFDCDGGVFVLIISTTLEYSPKYQAALTELTHGHI